MITAEFIELPTLKQPGVLMILARGGGYSKVQKGSVVIRLPEGLTALEGDLSRVVCLDDGCSGASDPTWQIRVRADGPGTFAVTGTMVVDVGRDYGRDEIDFRSELSITADSSWASHGRPTRCERVSGSKRFRYAGAFLVPISRPEQSPEDDILEHARVVGRYPVVCGACELTSQVITSLAVFLDERGRITEIRFLPVEGADAKVMETPEKVRAAVRRALEKWSFAPARTKGRSTADFLYVKVEVSPEP